jgi:hypothetical protein
MARMAHVFMPCVGGIRLASTPGRFAATPARGLSKNFLDIYVHFCYNYHVDH